MSSATIAINGVGVIKESDFNQQVARIEREISVGANNQLKVVLKGGKQGGFITVSIRRHVDDAVGPNIIVNQPAPGDILATASVTVSGSAVDPLSDVRSLTVNGGTVSLVNDLFQTEVTLAPGPNNIVLVGTDNEDNVTTVTIPVIFDTRIPEVTITSPADGALMNTPTIQVTGSATDDGAVSAVTVNGQVATLSGNTFSATLTLNEGFNTIEAVAVDTTGKSSATSVGVTLDTQPPTLTLESPVPGQSTNTDSIRVAGSVADLNGVAAFSINGTAVTLTDNRFDERIALIEGDNPITLIAQDRVGNSTTVSRTVNRFTLPTITITAPPNLSLANTTTITVTGTVSDPAASVTVNGVSAVVSGGSFTLAGVPLVEGGNILTATAVDARGRVGTASVTVVRDLTPPIVHINFPRNGAVVRESPITVTGLINDLVIGTVNSPQASVTVNGLPALVANRSFMLENVTLAPGDNIITAVATDASGNRTQTQVSVRFDNAPQAKIAVFSGNNQGAPIGTPLGQSLVARVTNVAGSPVANATVLFTARDNNGSFAGGERQIVVNTNADGLAQASFITGTRAGAGNQIVEALSAGFAGPAVFCINAQPGTAARLVVDSGDQQQGIAGQPLPQPFVAVVTDQGFNRLANIPVSFRVVRGSGVFTNGLPEITLNSDSDGRLSTVLTLGPDEGITNNIVEATLAESPQGPLASFVASGRVAGDPALTSVSGLVLDNTDQPVPGVIVHIEGSPLAAVSDANGMFLIPGVPVGTVKLFVDGSTATRPGTWPALEYVLVTIAGRDNTVGRPIYLLPLDVPRGLPVSQTQGGTLTLPEIPGFSLTVKPGSVTFPNGSKEGVISVTVVHNDKVPMTPNFGQQPRFIVTIQPANAKFDPPAAITLPNVDGLAPGEVTELYSFDHDLGMFVSIGPGTVSEDATVIRSNPGVGILKAGWHCGGNPATSGTPHNCDECEKCVVNHCEKDLSANSPPCCKGEKFKVDTQCCEAKGVLPKPAIRADLALEDCPRRTANGTGPIINGCSPLPIVQDDPIPLINPVCVALGFAPPFRPACNTHDGCFDTCRASKAACDDGFGGDLRAICRTIPDLPGGVPRPCRLICDAFAESYDQVVRNIPASQFYDPAQRKVCKCCP